jgi:hypothetical protein
MGGGSDRGGSMIGGCASSSGGVAGWVGPG